MAVMPGAMNADASCATEALALRTAGPSLRLGMTTVIVVVAGSTVGYPSTLGPWGGDSHPGGGERRAGGEAKDSGDRSRERPERDRKSTRLNSRHQIISYAV